MKRHIKYLLPLAVITAASTVFFLTPKKPKAPMPVTDGPDWITGVPPAPGPSAGSDNGSFSFNAGVAVDTSGNIYASDTNNHRVQVFDPSGSFVRGIGYGIAWTGGQAPSPREGILNGWFIKPFGIAVSSTGNVGVADNINHRVQVFDPQGTMFRAIGQGANWDRFTDALFGGFDSEGKAVAPTAGNEKYFFSYPAGIAFDPAGNIYVADTGNSRVHAFNPQGMFLRAIGDGLLNDPYGVCVGISGNIYVADTGNHRVLIFDPSGAFVRGIGSGVTWEKIEDAPDASSGIATGFFTNPAGVAVSLSGDIYVADTGNHRVQVFDPSGSFVRGIGQGTTWTKGQAPDLKPGFANSYFTNPSSVAVDPRGNIYVADSSNNRIQIFSRSGNFIRGIGQGAAWTKFDLELN